MNSVMLGELPREAMKYIPLEGFEKREVSLLSE